MTTQDFNIAPYFDDFDEDKQFYHILFRPGRPVQARELSQVQSLLLNQNRRALEHFFEDGSQIIPGQIAFDSKYSFVKVETQYLTNDIDVNNFVGTEITGQTSGVKALVINATGLEGTDPNTFFVKYLNSGTDGVTTTFAAEELLETNDTIPQFVNVLPATETPTGDGSAATIEEGFYFVKGLVGKVLKQVVILEKYSNTPTFRVGLDIQNSIVTAGDDTSLLDNALGSPNFSAPGADRSMMELVLSKRALDSTDAENFVELMRVSNGKILTIIDSPEYAYLEDELARRTFEESGNYTVRDFKLDVREHLDDGTNRGKFLPADGGDEAKIALGVEPGLAYVNGYRIQTIATQFVEMDKARDTRIQENGNVTAALGQYIIVDNIESFPDFSQYPQIQLQDTATVTPGTEAGTQIGTARIRGVELDSGTAGSGTETYKIFLFDIRMNTASNFSETRQIYFPDAVPFTADVVLSTSGIAELSEASKNISVFRFPISPIQTVRAENLSVDTLYDVKRVLEGTTTAFSVTFNSGTNEVFSNFNTNDWVLTILSNNGGQQGEIIDLAGKVSLTGSPTGKQAVIDLSSVLTVDEDVRLVATVTKQIAVEKNKTLQTDTVSLASPTSEISLGRADIFQVTGIYDSGDAGTAATNSDTNIIDNYTIDNGQRDNFYDLGRVILKAGQSNPVGQLLIEFEYFSHGSGDYFSVDSYDNQVEYDEIPSYIAGDGSVYELRDCLDFRPRIDNSGATFTGTGASLIEQIKPNSNIIADYFYFLNRIDKLAVDEDGNFIVIKGTPDISPRPPADLTNAMSLYQLSVRAFTFTEKDVITEFIDNRRYTMRDIGKLEKRIDNLEYYTSLSLLEKETASIQVVDPNTGLDRFKNGFIVDQFTEHGVGDVFNDDYRVSVDRSLGELRPPFNEQNHSLQLNELNSSNYQKTGDLITLPYTSEVFISQPYASRAENVNPYAIFTFLGSVQLIPESDEWKDTERLPDLNVNLPDNVDLLSQLGQSSGFTGTQWNSWQDQWAGTRQVVDQSSSVQRVTGNNVAPAGNLFPVRFDTTTRTTTAQTVGQRRTGTRTTITPRTVNTSIGDRVVGVEIIPFIRSREIEIKATRMKPDTQIYVFFDDVNVTAFCRPDGGTNGDPLVTNTNGEFNGFFTIPNTDTLRFRTGTRLLRLTDSPTDLDDNNTEAETSYTAQGLLEATQETILSTRVAQVDRRAVSDNRTVTRVSAESTTQTGEWFDPLAQTFLPEEDGGVFITGVELFFKTKSDNIPVTLQLRSTTNGYPSPFIFPFGEKTLNPADVNISSDASVGTTFTFDSPVYLLPNTEYCFVILADTIDYECYVARIGDNELGTEERISQQPYAGVMFKSQNASTWTADQNQDIKFNMLKAVFDTGVQAQVTFENEELVSKTLLNNSFVTTTGSNQVVVKQFNHGLSDNSIVTIANVPAGTYNGIPSTEFEGDFTVTNVDLDTYTISVTTNATDTGATGGAGVTTLTNIPMDVVHPIIAEVILPGTQTAWGIKATTAKHPHGSQIPYLKDTAFQVLEINESTEFTNPKLIASPINETNELGGDKSLELQGVLFSENPNLSPVIDLQRSSVIAVSNLIDDAQAGNVQNFIDEISGTGGSVKSKYITKRISLNEPAISLKIFAGVSKFVGTEVELYYKTRTADETGLFEEKDWVLLPPEVGNTSSNDPKTFEEWEYLADNLEPFITFAVKIVFRSTDSTKIPKLSDLRIIALGT